jgi:glycosyl transferase family 25
MPTLPIFVINLERDVERRRHMTAVLGGLGLAAEFVTAVNGRQLAESDRAAFDRARSQRIYGVDMMDTEIACYLSHYRLYERIVRERIDAALIMEDDVHVEPILPRIVADLLVCRFTEWLVVRLDSKRTEMHHPPTARYSGTRVAELSGGASLYRLRFRVLGTGAYLIRRAGAERMLAYGSASSCRSIRPWIVTGRTASCRMRSVPSRCYSVRISVPVPVSERWTDAAANLSTCD